MPISNVDPTFSPNANTLLKSSGEAKFKPFSYPWAFDAYQKQQQMHWLPSEVPMADDIEDWKSKLTEKDRSFLTNIFRFFTQADIEVNDCYMTKYAGVFKSTEVKMMLSAFSSFEAIHIEAYSYLIETLGMPDTIYTEFLKYKEMKDKHDYLQKFINSNHPQDVMLVMAVFGAFTEGLQLFASFALLLNYSRQGLMKGMGQIVTWSCKDETLHSTSIIKLFNTLKSEYPHYWDEGLRGRIYEACSTIVHFEDAFIDLCFNQIGDDHIRGLKRVDIRRYIRYLADFRLKQLGLKDVYLIAENPLPWVDEMTSNIEFANFFDQRVTSYSKNSLTGPWEDCFN